MNYEVSYETIITAIANSIRTHAKQHGINPEEVAEVYLENMSTDIYDKLQE